MSNRRKLAVTEQLGMPHGTASNRLRKQLLFKYVKLAGDNFCYKCGAEIETVDDLSVEHKEPWENRDSKLFWDLGNIAFSHLRCNTPNDRGTRKIVAPEGMNWCSGCKEFLVVSSFWKLNENKLHNRCKKCHNEDRREARQRKNIIPS